MTPTALRALLRARTEPDLRALAPEDDPERVLRAVEAWLDMDPTDGGLRRLHAAAWDHLDAPRGPAWPDAIRPGPPVRWDPWSITVEAVDTSTGATVLARGLRAHARTPTWRRALLRDAALLKEIHDDVEVRGEAWPALVRPVPGEPLLEGAPLPERLALRAVARVLADLARWEAAGLERPDPDDRELRQAPDGASLVSLHPVAGAPADLSGLAHRLERVGPGPHQLALHAARTFPPADADGLARRLIAALAQDLAARRHALDRAHRDRRHTHRIARLRGLVERLAAYPPPAGRGAVGVDLEGRPTLVQGDGHTLTWGPEDGPALAIVSAQGLHPRTARRLLRARAAAAPNPRLDAMVRGEAGYAERACRWVAAALGLRTLRKLLAATG
jgi:hypothetical protein